MDELIRHQLYEEINLLKEKLTKELSMSAFCGDERKWLNGMVDILGSKNYASSNVNDILWFYSHGLSKKDKIIDFGTGGGYIAHLASHITEKVIAYEYEGKWIGQDFNNKEYINVFSFMQKLVNEIDDKKVKFNFYQSLPINEKDESCDGIILYAVIEHIDSEIEEKVFKELYRILKPSGFLYIAKLPRLFSYQEFIARKLGLASHNNLFTKNKINILLETYGFKSIKMEKTGLFFNHPNKIVNFFYFLTSKLEYILKYTPIAILSHDLRIIAQKNK